MPREDDSGSLERPNHEARDGTENADGSCRVEKMRLHSGHGSPMRKGTGTCKSVIGGPKNAATGYLRDGSQIVRAEGNVRMIRND